MIATPALAIIVFSDAQASCLVPAPGAARWVTGERRCDPMLVRRT